MGNWIWCLVAAVVVFFIAAVVILPRIFLKNRYTLSRTYDRGIKKYKTVNNERGIVYQPALKIRKYIHQYILTADAEGKKQILCKIDDGISYIDYDVVVFGSNNKVLGVLRVKDIIDEQGYTKAVDLPNGTSYVTILLNAVDNKQFKAEKSVKISVWNLLAFDVLIIGLIACLGWCVNFSFSYIFGGVFRESYAASEENMALVLALSCAVGAVISVIVSMILFFKSRKK